jgi:hypothetical protein
MSTAPEEKAAPQPIDTAKSDNSAFSEEVPPTPHNVDTETTEKNEGLYFVKEQGAGAADGLKLAKDGRTVLIPQPSDDDEDPLNWPWLRKHKALFALLLPSLLTDWGMTWGTTLFEAQAMTWNMSIPDVARSVSGGIFLQGPGGVLAVPLVQRYGRYVIFNHLHRILLKILQLACSFLVPGFGVHHGHHCDLLPIVRLFHSFPYTSRIRRHFASGYRSLSCPRSFLLPW